MSGGGGSGTGAARSMGSRELDGASEGRHVMNEAETRYLAEVRADCLTLLGSGIEVGELTLSREGRTVVLRLSYRMSRTPGASEGRGATVAAAHAALRAQLAEDRIGLGLRALVDTATPD